MIKQVFDTALANIGISKWEFVWLKAASGSGDEVEAKRKEKLREWVK